MGTAALAPLFGSSLTAAAGSTVAAGAVGAGAGAAAATAGAGSLFTASNLLLGGLMLSGITQFASIGSQANAASQATDFQNQQLQLQIDRERTQAALEEQQRERRLRSLLASQRAAFGGAGVSADSGSPLRLQETAIGSLNEEQSLADFETGQRIANLNIQGQQNIIGNNAAQNAFTARRGSALFETTSDIIRTRL